MQKKQWNEMKKAVQDIKVEIQSVKKFETEEQLEMKNFGSQTEPQRQLIKSIKRWTRESQTKKARQKNQIPQSNKMLYLTICKAQNIQEI